MIHRTIHDSFESFPETTPRYTLMESSDRTFHYGPFKMDEWTMVSNPRPINWARHIDSTFYDAMEPMCQRMQKVV